ncbi:MAG: DNA-3-methyladenine glycosylase [Saprospiraceae bacterium]|nr:DNA-3-methyladenine glycosylase [Saprospiraceae bacterium]
MHREDSNTSLTCVNPEFYLSNDVVARSKDLLGAVLCTNLGGILTTGKIVETEAYKAPADKASHAYGNRLTKRTSILFEPGGQAYIYLCYGIHHLFNVVTGSPGNAHAILIRAIEPIDGIDHMLARRKLQKSSYRLTNGPGILCQALGITTDWNGESLLYPNNIWIEGPANKLKKKDIISSPRVGVDYAEECALWNWRFRIKGNPWCSPAK